MPLQGQYTTTRTQHIYILNITVRSFLCNMFIASEQ